MEGATRAGLAALPVWRCRGRRRTLSKLSLMAGTWCSGWQNARRLQRRAAGPRGWSYDIVESQHRTGAVIKTWISKASPRKVWIRHQASSPVGGCAGADPPAESDLSFTDGGLVAIVCKQLYHDREAYHRRLER